MANLNNVSHPSHYTQGGVECIDALRSALQEGFEDYCVGNCIKYLWRYRDKNGVEDLKKCETYLQWVIECATIREATDRERKENYVATH